jgi:16S rRNA (uracil1498-N3)-methyltransferase
VNPALRDSSAHVFVDDLASPLLDDTDRHHLGRVLRLRDGENVSVSDGNGRWRSCSWNDGNLTIVGDVVTEPAPASRVGVAFAAVKGDRTEWAVQKLTELGVDDIVVLAPTRRSVVRWSNVDKQLHKLRTVAREAAMQSRRVWLPKVSGLAPLADVIASPGAVVADPSGSALSQVDMPALIVVGPEGGFDPEEIPAATPRVSLGDTILRAETATLVAATLLVARHRQQSEESA